LFRKPASIIMLSLLVVSALALAHSVQLVISYAWTETIYIRADGSISPPTAPISSVDNVTYTLTDNILENGIDSTSAIVIQRDNIIIDGAGYTLNGTQPAGGAIGIDLNGRSNVTIKNMKITAFDHGIHLESSSGNSVNGNNITANTYVGIELYSSSDNNSIGGNSITANNGEGIHFASSNNNIVNGNIITNNGEGIYLYSSSDNNSISGNNITANNGDGIHLQSYAYAERSVSGNNITGNSITANKWDGIFLDVSSNNNRISGNKLTANYEYGIYLNNASHNSVSGNSFVNDGLFVYDSYWNVVTDNLVNGKPLVYLEHVSDYAVGDAGQVILVYSNNITVQNLNLSNTCIGVELWETKNTIISGNKITNDEVGIDLYSSSNNSVSENNITANTVYGVLLYFSNDNTFYHNNLINNTSQVYSLGSTNVWDNGAPQVPSIYIYILAALAVIIAVGAAAFIVRRKRKPP
jgi:parallel beta-helix repeat protein